MSSLYDKCTKTDIQHNKKNLILEQLNQLHY